MKNKKQCRKWISLALVLSLGLGMTANAQKSRDNTVKQEQVEQTEQSKTEKQKSEQVEVQKDQSSAEQQKKEQTENQADQSKVGEQKETQVENQPDDPSQKQNKKKKQQVKAQKANTGELQWTEEAQSGTAGIEAERVPGVDKDEQADTDEVRVFIVLNGDSVLEKGYSFKGLSENDSAQSLSQEIETGQGAVVEQIQRAVGAHSMKVRYHFSLLTNAVSATVQYGDLEKIRKVAGVEDVYVVPEYQLQDTAAPNTMTAGEMVGSYQAWDSGYTGAGQRIAIVDTGIDVNHPSFDAGAFTYGKRMTAEKMGRLASTEEVLGTADIANVLSQLKVSKNGNTVSPEALHINDKIAFAFNYAEENLDISHESSDHGTHVAGIAAANQYIPQGNGVYQEQPEGVSGIAKDAQLLVMKVFGKDQTAYTDDYMAAIEDALLLGADVVNLSLGTPNPGESKAFSGEEYVNEIFDRLLGSDMVVSISAGNNGSWAQSSSQGHNRAEDVNMNMLGVPGSYTNALTVASAVNAGYTGCGFQIGKRTYFYGEAEAQANIPSMTTLDTSGNGTDYEYVFLDSYGKVSDYQGWDVRGKIVFVKKGEISYIEKHQNAQNAGAAALFIINDDFSFPKLNLSGSKATIPCAILGWEDSWKFLAKEGQKIIRILSKPVSDHKAAEGYQMSEFSAWGVPGDLALKPEITAPGENIYAPQANGGYGCLSGTSMAAPSIAGMSAVVSEYIQRNGLEQKTGLSGRALIQSLLMSTAIPLKEKDKEEYSPRKQGSGLANVKAATSTPAYLLMGEKQGNDGKVKAELGDDPSRSGEYTFSFQVCNISGKNQYYTLDSSILTEQVLDNKWIEGSSYKLQPQVIFSSENEVLMYDLNGDQRVDQQDASELLRHINESVKLERVEGNPQKFDFNGDGALNTADVNWFMQELMKQQPTLNLQERTLEVKEQAQVSVKVVLSNADREYLDTYFKHGMYIDGFVYLRGAVDLSIPMLAFYGNWSESSMFEPFNYLEFSNHGDDTAAMSYSAVEKTNYLSYYAAEEDSAYCYASNLYLKGGDKKYLPERNAFSNDSGDCLESVVYTLIRNAAVVETSIVNEETGEVYYQEQQQNLEGAYYDSEESGWCNTEYISVLGWKGTDAKGKPLPEGTTVRVTITALPEYYKDKPEQAADGARFSIPITIDNTKPRLIDMQDTENGKIRLTFEDNRYTAAVKVYDKDQETLLKTYGVNQEQPASLVELDIKDPKKVFYLNLVDYAGNTVSYRVNRSQSADTPYAEGVILDQSTMKLIKGNTGCLKATVTPEGVLDNTVTWSSENPAIAKVNKKGVVTGLMPGTTTITATANARNAAGELVTAVCEVTVEELSVSLNGLIWSSEGEVYFYNIDTAHLPEYTVLSGNQKTYYRAATMVKDKVFATVDQTQGNVAESELFLIDPADNYKAVSQGKINWCPADLAYSPNTNLVFGVEGTYLQWFAANAPQEESGAVDVGGHTIGENLVGIAYAGYSDEQKYGSTEWFYLVTQSGELFQIGYRIEENIFVYQDLGSTGIATGDEDKFNSLCYDQASGYIFWSAYDGGDTAKLYALEVEADGEGNSTYIGTSLLGNFPDNAWPAMLLGTAPDNSKNTKNE